MPDAASPDALQNLQPLGIAGEVAHLALATKPANPAKPVSSVSLFDQGLVQILQAAVTGLEPKQRYVLALADHPDGAGSLQPLAAFMTNPAGSAIVNVAGPIRQIVQGPGEAERRYLVIAPGDAAKFGAAVQVQTP